MKFTPRVWTILLAGFVLLALLLLASSLNALELAEGKPVPLGEMAPTFANSAENENLLSIFMIVFRVLMIIVWILIPIYIVYLIISKEARKRFLRDMVTLLPILFFLYWLTSSDLMQNREGEESGLLGINQPMDEGVFEQPPAMPVFQPPPDWVTTVTSLVLAVALTAIVALIIFTVWRRNRRKEELPLQKIERRAQDALDDLAAGGDLREVIQRCYFQMIDVLHEYRNIQRDRDVTPHEFERLLARHGLPPDPVHQLTMLFEQVRYGAHQPGRQEERLAISSLSAIVSACQRGREREGRS